jgi:hypothetical protein
MPVSASPYTVLGLRRTLRIAPDRSLIVVAPPPSQSFSLTTTTTVTTTITTTTVIIIIITVYSKPTFVLPSSTKESHEPWALTRHGKDQRHFSPPFYANKAKIPRPRRNRGQMTSKPLDIDPVPRYWYGNASFTSLLQRAFQFKLASPRLFFTASAVRRRIAARVDELTPGL